ncbi:T9SS type B sorting domain-containing protein [Flavobacterium ponti]|uniref:T9SS type B sorting domain-containing protein n=1 Tax=Flavobacterium ponti TaxID=665133 RepID=A0ABV9P116_9FLAO
MKHILSSLALIFFHSFLFGQNLPNDCVNYIQACDNQSVSYNVSGAGIQEIIPMSCSSQENNSFWIRVTIEQAGTLGFELIPSTTNITEDYDFWVFGPDLACNNLGTPIRCSTTNPAAINQQNNHTGMNTSSTDTTEGPGADGDSFVKQLDVLAGESYFIVIDRPVGNSSFTLNWNGTATIANPFAMQNFNDFDDVVLCDDGADNIEPYDFSNLTASYLGSITGYTISYFDSNQNASLNTNELIGLNNVSQGTYFVRITNTNSSCFIVMPIEVVFNSIQPFQIVGCDDTPDGMFTFDTANLESDLLNGLTGFDLSYTDENNNPLPSPLPSPFTTTEQTINVTLTSNTGNPCSFNTTIEFIINNKPQFFALPSNLVTLCNQNDPHLQAEFANFDTSTFQSTILNGQTGIVVEYYDENNVQLSSPLPNPFKTSTQNISVKVINTNDTNCFTTGIIPFNVISLPDVELVGNEKFVCKNLPNYFATIDAGLNNSSQIASFTYQWFLNNDIISGATSYNLQINEAGNYTVKVTNSNNCESTRLIVVKESNIATIDDVEVYDLTDNNILVIVANGNGNYLYSLDNLNFQISNTFNDVLPGIYTVYVKDINGCGIAENDINVLGAPKFFTPNGDSFNDFWNIKGVDAKLNAKTVIRIFDRYGKFLAQINPLSPGWNGIYNNRPLPADDYWYTIELNNGRIVRGHFSLLR